MALEVVWTKRAEDGYDRIIKYLEKEWTDREIHNFIEETREFLELLKRTHNCWNHRKHLRTFLEGQ